MLEALNMPSSSIKLSEIEGWNDGKWQMRDKTTYSYLY